MCKFRTVGVLQVNKTLIILMYQVLQISNDQVLDIPCTNRFQILTDMVENSTCTQEDTVLIVRNLLTTTHTL